MYKGLIARFLFYCSEDLMWATPLCPSEVINFRALRISKMIQVSIILKITFSHELRKCFHFRISQLKCSPVGQHHCSVSVYFLISWIFWLAYMCLCSCIFLLRLDFVSFDCR